MALFAALCVVAVPGATAAVYWGGDGAGITAANLDGGGVDHNFLRLTYDGGGPWDLAIDDTYLYWRNHDGIWRVNLDGPATLTSVVPGIAPDGITAGMAVGDGYLFWARRRSKAIGRAALDGSDRDESFLSGIGEPCDVAVGGGYVFWPSVLGIGRARLDGSEVDREFIWSPGGRCGVAVDSSHVYWSVSGGIARADLDGGSIEPAFITGIGRAESIAVREGIVYWLDRREGMSFPTVGRAVPGQVPVANWIPITVSAAAGLAVDSRPQPVARPQPSRRFRIGQVRRDRRRGTIVIDIWVPEQGALALRTRKVAWRVIPKPNGLRGRTRERIKVWAGARTRVGRVVRRKLNERGFVGVNLQITYSEAGQLPAEYQRHFVLAKKVPRKRRSVGHHR